jgi:hypothetical protein
MKLINHLFGTGTCLARLLLLAGAVNDPVSHNKAAQDATAFAIQVHDESQTTHCIRLTSVQYAYPISQWQQAVTNILDAVDKPNTLWPYRTLSGPLNRTIVGPNADTLYIWVAVDLSHEDLVLTIPNITDGRNWIWPFYDMSVSLEMEKTKD